MSYLTLFFKHVKWKNVPKPPLLSVEELRKFRDKLQTQLAALEKTKSEKKVNVTEEFKPFEKQDPNDKDEPSRFFLSSYLYWPVKSTLETSAISDYIKSLKLEPIVEGMMLYFVLKYKYVNIIKVGRKIYFLTLYSWSPIR